MGRLPNTAVNFRLPSASFEVTAGAGPPITGRDSTVRPSHNHQAGEREKPENGQNVTANPLGSEHARRLHPRALRCK